MDQSIITLVWRHALLADLLYPNWTMPIPSDRIQFASKNLKNSLVVDTSYSQAKRKVTHHIPKLNRVRLQTEP